MGARLALDERTLTIEGGTLAGADIHAADIRAGGALVVAALAAEGTSRLTGTEYLDRGYENLAARLRGLNARVGAGEPAAHVAAYGARPA